MNAPTTIAKDEAKANGVRGASLIMPNGRMTGRIAMPGQAPDPNLTMIMHCDALVGGRPCTNTPMNGLRVVVPAVKFMDPAHRGIRMMTRLHFCDPHWQMGNFKVQDFLPKKVRAEMEGTAKAQGRPADFRLDFDAAFIERVLTTSPEYRKYMQAWGLSFAAG